MAENIESTTLTERQYGIGRTKWRVLRASAHQRTPLQNSSEGGKPFTAARLQVILSITPRKRRLRLRPPIPGSVMRFQSRCRHIGTNLSRLRGLMGD